MASSESETAVQEVPTERDFRQWLRDMPRWKKVAVGVALTTVVVAGVWTLTVSDATPAAAGGAGSTSELRTSLLEGGASAGADTAGLAAEPASKGVFRLGFSFLAGFCIGSFLRATLKVAAIALGFWLLMTLVLGYYGLVDVDWQAIDSVWERFTSNVAAEWGSFQRFMTGSLPATGLVITGLGIGLKRH
jgi:uncharacterized membrane protein (Fun14 family)